jgi:hypothetical protein
MNVAFIGLADGVKSIEDVDRVITHEYGLLLPVYFYEEDGVEKMKPLATDALTGEEVGTLYNFIPQPAAGFIEAWCRSRGVTFIDRSEDNISIWMDSYAWSGDEEAVEEDADPDPFSDNPAPL